MRKTVYHEIAYEHIARTYPDRKITLTNAESGNEDRSDLRNKLKYTVGAFLFDSVLVKLANEWYIHDSNDIYQEYYDYWVHRMKPAVMYFVSDEMYLFASFSLKNRQYKDRRKSEDAGEIVTEKTCVYNMSMFYDASENVTFSVTYTYSENYPNDPVYKYSGNVISCGVNYSF